MTSEFHLFRPLHLAILIAIPMLAAALALVTRRYPAWAIRIRVTFGVLLAADALTWYGYRYFVQGVRFPEILPLELCDASFWLTAIALLTLAPRAFALAYYWGIAGSGMAMLTPYLRAPTHTYQSVQYFTGHGLLIVGVLFLIWSRQARPRSHSWWFAWWAMNVYGAAIGVVDYWCGTNFMYLRQKPGASSLFDALGPWPWYIVGADVVALVLFRLMQAPFSSREKD